MVVALVGGGARSGKSRFALDYAARRFERPGFVATAQALDGEMRERISSHQAGRGPRWTTIEAPVDIAGAMRAGACDGYLVDCLTLWLSNVMLPGVLDPEAAMEQLVAELASGPPCVVVTNEVGCGIVPESALARRFRDLAGSLNQKVAAVAEEVYWMAFGIALPVKSRK